MIIKIFPAPQVRRSLRLADAELHFEDGPLAGLKIVGFTIWQKEDGRRNVSLPARSSMIGNVRHWFAHVRPVDAANGAQERLTADILAAYEAYEEVRVDAGLEARG